MSVYRPSWPDTVPDVKIYVRGHPLGGFLPHAAEYQYITDDFFQYLPTQEEPPMQIHEKLDAIHNRLALVEEKIDRSLLVRAEPDNPPTPTGGGPVHLADYLEFDPRVWEDGDSDGTGDGKHGFWNPMPGRFQAVEIRDRVNPGGISPDGSGGHGSAFTINYFVEGDGFVPARSLRVRPDWVQARLPKDTISIQIEDDGGRSQWVDVPNDVFRKAAGRPRL